MQLTNKRIKRFVTIASKIITAKRLQKRLQKIKDFLKGVKTREQAKMLVNQDWQKAEYAGVGKKDFI